MPEFLRRVEPKYAAPKDGASGGGVAPVEEKRKGQRPAFDGGDFTINFFNPDGFRVVTDESQRRKQPLVILNPNAPASELQTAKITYNNKGERILTPLTEEERQAQKAIRKATEKI